MSEISAIGGVEGPLAFESIDEENLENALEDIGLFLREVPAVWAYTSANIFCCACHYFDSDKSRSQRDFRKA